MKVFNKIIQSDAEPSRNNIWFKDKKLWFYNNNGWEALTDEVGKPADLTGYLKEGDLTKYLNDGGYLKDSDIAKNVPGDYKIPGLFPLTSDGMKQMLVRSPSRLNFYVQNIPITEVDLDTRPLEQFFQSEYDTKFNRMWVNLPTAEGVDSDWVPDAFPYMIGKNNLLVSMGFLHEMLARMLSGNGNTLSWRYLSFADFDNKEESLYPYTGEPIDWDSSGVDNCTITRRAYYFNGTRDISSTSTNVVQEKGLYTVINNFRDEILGEDGKLKSGLIGLYNNRSNNRTDTIIPCEDGDCPISITYEQGKLAPIVHTYDGTRDIDMTSVNLVQERGLIPLKAEINALDNAVTNAITEFTDVFISDNGFINTELIPLHNFVTEYTVDPSEESVIIQSSDNSLNFEVRILPTLASDTDIEHLLADNMHIPNLINAGHLSMVANYLNNKIVAPDKVPVKAGAGITVSKSDSDITIDIKDYDKLAKVAVLNVGTTAEVKTHNQAQIPTDKTTFFVQIENGIGVAKFTTTGGSAVVTTGEGTRIKYNIGPGYSCSKDTEYFEVTDLVYTMPDIALNTLDSTTNMASLLTDEQADQMFKCSYIKFNLKKMSGEHVIGTLPITCSCSSLGFSEKVFQTPTLSIGNTDFTNIKITVKKMTPEGGTEEHWYAVLETV